MNQTPSQTGNPREPVEDFRFTISNIMVLILIISFLLASINLIVHDAQKPVSTNHYFFWPTHLVGRLSANGRTCLRLVAWIAWIAASVVLSTNRQRRSYGILVFLGLSCLSLLGLFLFDRPHNFWEAFNYQRIEQILLTQVFVIAIGEIVIFGRNWQNYVCLGLCAVILLLDWTLSCEIVLFID